MPNTIDGWTVVVVSRQGVTPGLTIRELYDVAIPDMEEAEEAVMRQFITRDTLIVSGVSPLTNEEVKALGLAPGEIKKQQG